MRLMNSFKNAFFSTLSNILTILIGLIAQALFIKFLGNEYLGLNSLFSNIITMLSIVELGIGNSIIYSMYKPIAENKIEEIKSLMFFYKKCYRLIGFVVAILGFSLIPFLNFFVNLDSITININVYLVYILFLTETFISYFLSYKRSIFYASQQNSIISIIHIFYTILLNFTQIIILFLTKNYYLYLIVKIICRIIENTIITLYANKKFPYLIDTNINPLDKNVQSEIFKKIKALFFHKIGAFAVLSSDNIIISKMLGLVTVGLYSNYYMIINAVEIVFGQIVNSTTASIGNMLVTESKEKIFDIFKKIRFLNFWISSFACTCIFVIMDSFIIVWIGKDFLLPRIVLATLTFNLYLKLMRSSYSCFKEAAGIYHEDRFVPIIESVTNILFSIIFCHFLGLAGVFMGTVVSGLALWLYSYPKFVYKGIFNQPYKNYFIETFKFIFIFIAICFVTFLISNLITFTNIYLELIFNCIICLIIPNLILFIIYRKSDEIKYFYYSFFSKIIIKRN